MHANEQLDIVFCEIIIKCLINQKKQQKTQIHSVFISLSVIVNDDNKHCVILCTMIS